MSNGSEHTRPKVDVQKPFLGRHGWSLGDIDDAGAPTNGPASGDTGVVDLFSGCGGLSLGFETIGRLLPDSFRLAAAIDIDPPAVETYSLNLPISATPSDLLRAAAGPKEAEAVVSEFSLRPEGPMVLVGGPPCQGFSAHRKMSTAPLDARNALVTAFANLAVATRPDFVVMENVPELLSEKHWSLFKSYERTLTDAGYLVRAQVVNMAEFGVPQFRFRALILAAPFDFRMPDPILRPEDVLTVRDAIGDLPRVAAGQAAPDDPFHVSAHHRTSTLDVIRKIPHDGGRRPKGVGPACLQRVDGFRDVYGRLAWDRPANTITAYARNPASGSFVHPEQDRGLTVREAALLQGFPGWFRFSGSFDAKFSQIGNAVPPRFAACVAAHVADELAGRDAPKQLELGSDVTAPVRNSFSSGLAGLKPAYT